MGISTSGKRVSLKEGSHDYKLRSDRGIKVTLQGENSPEPVTLEYHLFDHSVADKWYQNVKTVEQKRGLHPTTDGEFFGAPLWPKEQLVKDFERVITTINSLKGTVVETDLSRDIPQEELNRLHTIFEKLAHTPEYVDDARAPEVHKAVLDLNLTIHRYECHREEGNMGYHIEILFVPGQECDLAPEDYEYFTPCRKFGHLYLTYGQVGVPPLAAFHSDTLDKLNPQRVITAGSFLNFSPDIDYDQNDWEKMGTFLKQNHQLDIEDPQLAIGYVPLGKLVGRELNQDAIFHDIKNNMRITKMETI